MRTTRLLLLLSAAWVVAGCDTFKPRRPEAPLGPPLSVSYAAPESTLDTMRRGVEDRTQQGVNAYMNALADSAKDNHAFYAFFDTDVLKRWQTINPGRTPPAAWSVDHERNFITIFMNSVITKSSVTMDWLPGLNPDQPGPTGGLYFRKYVVYTYSQETGDPDDTLAIGYAALTFAQVSASRWVITRWQDQVDLDVGVDHPFRFNWQSFSERRLATY